MAAKDWLLAQRTLDEILKNEPGNAEATAAKTQVAMHIAMRNRSFTVTTTSITGAKTTTKGPAGFDVGGATVAQTDYSAQISCAVNPARVDTGESYSLECNVQNTGKKGFKIESVQIAEVVDGGRKPAPTSGAKSELGVQQRATIGQQRGSWSATRDYRVEVTVATDKGVSFSATLNWK